MKSNLGRLIPGVPFNLNCLMKKIIKSMAVLMAAAAALTACKAELTESLESMQGVSFSIEEMDDPVTDETSDLDGPETRTVFGNPSNKTIPVLWTANQGVSVFAESSAVSSARDWSVVPSKDGKTAKLTGSAMNLSGFSNGYFVLLSPSASFASHTAGNTYAMITVPATQTPTATWYANGLPLTDETGEWAIPLAGGERLSAFEADFGAFGGISSLSADCDSGAPATMLLIK